MSYFMVTIASNKPISCKNSLQLKVTNIATKYGVTLDKLTIQVYDTVDELYDDYFAKTNEDGERKDTFCGYVDTDNHKLIHIISEESFIKTFTEKYNLKNLQLMYELTILHECVHSITMELNKNIVNKGMIELIEGMAVYESGQLDYMRQYNAIHGRYYGYGEWFERYILQNNYERLRKMLKNL